MKWPKSVEKVENGGRLGLPSHNGPLDPPVQAVLSRPPSQKTVATTLGIRVFPVSGDGGTTAFQADGDVCRDEFQFTTESPFRRQAICHASCWVRLSITTGTGGSRGHTARPARGRDPTRLRSAAGHENEADWSTL